MSVRGQTGPNYDNLQLTCEAASKAVNQTASC